MLNFFRRGGTEPQSFADVKPREPEAPYSIGESFTIVDSSIKVAYRVDKVVQSDYDTTNWYSHGVALVTLPIDTLEFRIEPVVDKGGDVEQYAIHYASAVKSSLYVLGKHWTKSNEDPEWNFRMVIDGVEVTKGQV